MKAVDVGVGWELRWAGVGVDCQWDELKMKTRGV